MGPGPWGVQGAPLPLSLPMVGGQGTPSSPPSPSHPQWEGHGHRGWPTQDLPCPHVLALGSLNVPVLSPLCATSPPAPCVPTLPVSPCPHCATNLMILSPLSLCGPFLWCPCPHVSPPCQRPCPHSVPSLGYPCPHDPLIPPWSICPHDTPFLPPCPHGPFIPVVPPWSPCPCSPHNSTIHLPYSPYVPMVPLSLWSPCLHRHPSPQSLCPQRPQVPTGTYSQVGHTIDRVLGTQAIGTHSPGGTHYRDI